jgi:hypothetical protein
VHGERDYLGVAHICLQPVALLGLTFAAVGLPHVPAPVRGLALLGLLVDACLGVLLQIYLLHNDFAMSVQGDKFAISSHADMGGSALANGVIKFRMHLIFLGDHAIAAAGLIKVLAALTAVGICIGLWFLAARSARSAITLASGQRRSNA